MKTPQTEHLAMVAVALAGFAWGIFWIPLRALDQAGITGVWAIVLFYVLPALTLTPLFILRRHQLLHSGWSLHIAGFLAGLSLVLYAGALVFTDVVRALLLYYMTPLWSTFLARIFLGETITRARWSTILLALIGLVLILEVDQGIDSSTFGPGDWMGLASGIVWAMAAVWMKSDGEGSGTDFTLSYFAWGSLAAFALTLLPFEGAAPPPDWATIRHVLPWVLPVAILLIIPPSFAVMWGATVLSPGLLGILFMTEISAGAVSAAIWAGEPFGLREVAGIIVITAAGLLEPVQKLGRRAIPP
ncbi:MAG: DMT family transporter [Paracoccaceae bacterium]|nr:DMT family transporter [Paracoccaceae bacterium]